MKIIIDAIQVYPIIMGLLTIIGLFILIIGMKTFYLDKSKVDNRRKIIGSGLLALIIGLLVFPIEYLQMIQVFRAAQSPESPGISIAIPRFYTLFVPLLYGAFWFMLSLFFILLCNKKGGQKTAVDVE